MKELLLSLLMATLRQSRKGDWRKRLLAAMIPKQTTVRPDWIGEQLIWEPARASAAWWAKPENALPPIAP